MPRIGWIDRQEEKDRKLFVGGLDYVTTNESLREYFEQFGELIDFVVMKSPDTKRSRGFGFVTFRDPEMLENAFAAQPHIIDGKAVELKHATTRADNGGGGSGSRGEGVAVDMEGKSMRRLFVGGINDATTEDELRAHFEQFGDLDDCHIMKYPDSGRSRGFGFVTYAKAAQLDDCQANRPHIVTNKTLETKRATQRSNEPGKQDTHAKVKKIFLGGVTNEVEDEDIKDYFSQYGEVTMVEQKKWTETGKKRGFGFVEFEDYDVVDKVCLIGIHYIKGRKLGVKKALNTQEIEMKKALNTQGIDRKSVV